MVENTMPKVRGIGDRGTIFVDTATIYTYTYSVNYYSVIILGFLRFFDIYLNSPSHEA